MKPYEIIAAPLEVWLAPVGTPFPELGVAPSDPWQLLGVSGDRNLEQGGLTVTHQQTIEQVRTAGATGPVKAFRTEEGLVIEFTLLDVTLETYAKALNDQIVTNETGTKALKLHRGPNVATHALLARGPSAYGDDLPAQYEVPVVFQNGNPAPVFRKGNPAGLLFSFVALEDPDAATPDERFGRLRMQAQAT